MIRIGAAVCAAVLVAFPALAQGRAEPTPKALEGVGITEHVDARLPLDRTFTDEEGRTVVLGDYFDGKRPVVLAFVYYSCPMLCTLVLNGMVDALKDVNLAPEKDFEIVTVSIDPGDTPELAKAKKANYIRSYGREGAAAAWHFLTGEESNIRPLADAVGFGYRWLPEKKQFAHAAAIYVITPDGRISRYLYGVMFPPRTLRLALVEAGQGNVGSAVDRFILYCYHYDAAEGKYAPAAMKIMRLGGGVTVLVLGVALAVFWRREVRKKKRRTT